MIYLYKKQTDKKQTNKQTNKKQTKNKNKTKTTTTTTTTNRNRNKERRKEKNTLASKKEKAADQMCPSRAFKSLKLIQTFCSAWFPRCLGCIGWICNNRGQSCHYSSCRCWRVIWKKTKNIALERKNSQIEFDHSWKWSYKGRWFCKSFLQKRLPHNSGHKPKPQIIPNATNFALFVTISP